MKKIIELNYENSLLMKNLYNDFVKKSLKDYHFELQPLGFDDFCECIKQNLLQGFILTENNVPSAFLLYTTNLNQAVELNLIHCIDEIEVNERRHELIKYFLDQVKELPDWKVISYPMLGVQSSYVRYITHHGFKLVGQAVIKFNFHNSVQQELLKRADVIEIPEDYKISCWKNEYSEDAAKIMNETFKDLSDAEYDPRFKTLEGTTDIINKIVENTYGELIPEATSILLYNDKPVGICFINLTSPQIANIPLIGILQSHKKKGFGSLLMKNSLEILSKMIKEKTLQINEVNASVDTDNYPATRTYRKIGFREDYTYPHAYLKNN